MSKKIDKQLYKLLGILCYTHSIKALLQSTVYIKFHLSLHLILYDCIKAHLSYKLSLNHLFKFILR